jgi:hypothetical protein
MFENETNQNGVTVEEINDLYNLDLESLYEIKEEILNRLGSIQNNITLLQAGGSDTDTHQKLENFYEEKEKILRELASIQKTITEKQNELKFPTLDPIEQAPNQQEDRPYRYLTNEAIEKKLHELSDSRRGLKRGSLSETEASLKISELMAECARRKFEPNLLVGGIPIKETPLTKESLLKTLQQVRVERLVQLEILQKDQKNPDARGRLSTLDSIIKETELALDQLSDIKKGKPEGDVWANGNDR